MRCFSWLTLGLCLLLALPGSSRAWNATGHMVVARLAWSQLTPAQRQKAHELLKKHPHYASYLQAEKPAGVDEGEWAFLRSSIWADWIRPPKNFPPADLPTHAQHKFHRGPWHYVSVPYKPGDPVPASLPATLASPTDVLEQMAVAIDILKGTTTTDAGRAAQVSNEQNRAVRLCWLAHQVGDLHQPLHAISLVDAARFPDGNHDDQGGNRLAIRPDIGAEPTKLHTFWDALLGTDAHHDTVSAIAQSLASDPRFAASELTELTAHPSIQEWALESHVHAIESAYLKGTLPVATWDDFAAGRITTTEVPVLGNGIERDARRLAQRRVVLAGHRLAKLVAESLP
ncbi:MAG: S1/P1 nuclease [Pirellulaceae bacterium]|nr:S1/P1 nuclease [Pirellulaceae bacterium]